MKHLVRLFECADCGMRYPVIPYLRKAAPHGVDKKCHGKTWVPVIEEFEVDK